MCFSSSYATYDQSSQPSSFFFSLYVGCFYAPWLHVILFHFSHDRSNWPLTFSSTTFQNCSSTVQSAHVSAPYNAILRTVCNINTTKSACRTFCSMFLMCCHSTRLFPVFLSRIGSLSYVVSSNYLRTSCNANHAVGIRRSTWTRTG